MTTRYFLSFDPGGSSRTYAYSLSSLTNQIFSVLESGFAPIVEEIARPDFFKLTDFRNRILSTYPEGQMDLIAERFMSRGFVSWLMEHVGFHNGWWCNGWDRGTARMIMAAQWKKELRKRKELPTGRYDDWWAQYWSDLLSPEEFKKKTVHVQDCVAMSYWYATKELKLTVDLPQKEVELAKPRRSKKK